MLKKVVVGGESILNLDYEFGFRVIKFIIDYKCM